VLADPRQVEHERLFIAGLDLILDPLGQGVGVDALRRSGEVVVPVRAPLDRVHRLARQLRTGAGDRVVLGERRGDQLLVVVGPRLVVVVDHRHVRVREDAQELLDPAAGLEAQATLAIELPPSVPLFLVLPALRIAESRLGLDVVEPHVLGAGPIGPDLLAGDRAGVAADALVEVHHHSDLCLDLHSNLTSLSRLRSTVTSSRCDPVGPW
jgi:hypothetical protein